MLRFRSGARASTNLRKLSSETRAARSVQFICDDLASRVRRELASPNPNARMAALNGLAWELANDPNVVDGNQKTLREQALGVAKHIAIRAQRGPQWTDSTADDHVVEPLVQRALSAPEPQVMSQALPSLVGLLTTLDLSEVFEEGLRDESTGVSVVAVQHAQDQARRPLH